MKHDKQALTFRSLGNDKFGFFDREHRQVGPDFRDRSTAMAYTKFLLKQGLILPKCASNMLGAVNNTFDILLHTTGTEPTTTLSFVPSRGGTKGVFIIRFDDDNTLKLLSSSLNAAYALSVVHENTKDGVISDSHSEELKQQIAAAFEIIVGKQPIQQQAVYSKQLRSVAVMVDGGVNQAPNNIEEFLEGLDEAAKNNAINEATYRSLRAEAPEAYALFDATFAEQTQKELFITVEVSPDINHTVVFARNGLTWSHSMNTLIEVTQMLQDHWTMKSLTPATRRRLRAEAQAIFDQIDEQTKNVKSIYTIEKDHRGFTIKVAETGEIVANFLTNMPDIIYRIDSLGIDPLESYLLKREASKLIAEQDKAKQDMVQMLTEFGQALGIDQQEIDSKLDQLFDRTEA